MTLLFRSKSCSISRLNSSQPILLYDPRVGSNQQEHDQETEEDEDDEESSDRGYSGDNDTDDFDSIYGATTPFRTSPQHNSEQTQPGNLNNNNNHQFPLLTLVVAALRKSLVTCSVERNDVAANLDISCPTNVRHVSHVTFDRFNGSFLGLPNELQPDVPRRVPSASASIFGVSPQSLQCSYDNKGNSVPTILLKMQHRLYAEGGLQAEGIFRINAENGQEENVRDQLNRGIVPRGIDVHCIAGLIKAWFRELPAGVLDSLTPEQVMHCNTEGDSVQLIHLLPHTEAALLDWAVNLMADVVQHEHHNKMNARNIAMVFAPNMTQMADPLTALIHAVQVMNLLKMLIEKNLREREPTTTGQFILTRADSPSIKVDDHSSNSRGEELNLQSLDDYSHERHATSNLVRSATLDRLESDTREKLWSLNSQSGVGERHDSTSSMITSYVTRKKRILGNSFKGGYENAEVEGILDKLSLRKGVRRLCRHPVFQLSKPVKKSGDGGQFIY